VGDTSGTGEGEADAGASDSGTADAGASDSETADPSASDSGTGGVGNGSLSGHALLAKLAWALRSEAGDARPHNEDFAGVFAPTTPDDAWDRGPLFVLADGLGGHASGEVASRRAVEAAIRAWTTGAPGAPLQALRTAARSANVAVFDAGLERGNRGMATTFTALTLAGRQAIVAHVGDSRCYLVRRGACSQLTDDHSRVGEMLRAGLLTPDQAANHPSRSMITRTVGSEPAVQADLIRQDTEAGDTFVLCSDGLWDVVASDDIASVVAALGTPGTPTVAEVADHLVELALGRDTPDNVTVLVVRVSTDRPVPSAGARRGLFRRGPG